MKLYSIGKFASLVGVSKQTLRKMHEKGELIPSHISQGGTRYYSEDQINYFKRENVVVMQKEDVVEGLKLLKEGIKEIKPNILQTTAIERYVVNWKEVIKNVNNGDNKSNAVSNSYTFEDVINAAINLLK